MKNIILHLDELNGKLVFLASPYNDGCPEVRENRYIITKEAVSLLLRLGIYAYSPIAYSHRLLARYPDWREWRDWAGFDLAMLAACDALCVLQETGWRTSEDIEAEIEAAEKAGKPIYYARLNELFMAFGVRYSGRLEIKGELPTHRVAVRDSEKPPPVS